MRWYCECGQRLKSRDSNAGRTIACPECGERVQVPLVAPQAAAQTPAAAEGDEAFGQQTFILDQLSGIYEPSDLCPHCGTLVPMMQPNCPECGESLQATVAEDAVPPAGPSAGVAPPTLPDDDQEAADLAAIDGSDSDLSLPGTGGAAGSEPDEPADARDNEQGDWVEDLLATPVGSSAEDGPGPDTPTGADDAAPAPGEPQADIDDDGLAWLES